MLQLGILLVAALLIGVDQVSKLVAVQTFKGADPISVIDGVFSFTYTQNTGAAWSMFDGERWLLIGVTSVMLLGLLAVLLSGRFRNHKMALCGGVLVVAGGIGNLIDRIVRGYVVDFIRVDFFDFPIFNVADCFVVIGAVLLFVYFVFIYSENDAKSAPQTEEEEELPHGKADGTSDRAERTDAT